MIESLHTHQALTDLVPYKTFYFVITSASAVIGLILMGLWARINSGFTENASQHKEVFALLGKRAEEAQDAEREMEDRCETRMGAQAGRLGKLECDSSAQTTKCAGHQELLLQMERRNPRLG